MAYKEGDEDFGLLGVGRLPTPHESARVAATAFTETTSYRFWYDPFEPTLPFFPIDGDEGAMGMGADYCDNYSFYLDSMLLYVKKRSHASMMNSSQFNSLPSSVTSTTSQHLQNKAGIIRKTSSSQKKQKKHNSDGSLHSSSGRSEEHRSSIQNNNFLPSVASSSSLKSSKSSGNKFITDAAKGARANARVAAIRLRNKISESVSDAFDKRAVVAGSGIPLLFSSASELEPSDLSSLPAVNVANVELTEIPLLPFVAKLIDPFKLRERVNMTASSQRAALRRSLIAPCKVDFGPFRSGYLSLPGGMSGISPPKSQIGITLPLGVKLHHREEDFQSEPWTEKEDSILKAAAVKFCFNWHVASRAVTHVGRHLNCKQFSKSSASGAECDLSPDVSKVTRSARQCRERWQTFAKNQPSLAKAVRRSERLLREMASVHPSKVPQSLGSVLKDRKGPYKIQSDFLFPSLVIEPASSESEQGVQVSVLPSEANSVIRSRFKVIKSTSDKRLHPPTAIPGCGACRDKPMRVQPHSSHIQVVQASVSAQQEMWPLQLLDLADKQRTSMSQGQATLESHQTSHPNATSTSVPQQRATTIPITNSVAPPTHLPQQRQQQYQIHQQQMHHLPMGHPAVQNAATATNFTMEQPAGAQQLAAQEMLKRGAVLSPSQNIRLNNTKASSAGNKTSSSTPQVPIVSNAPPSMSTTSTTYVNTVPCPPIQSPTQGDPHAHRVAASPATGHIPPQNTVGMSPLRVGSTKSLKAASDFRVLGIEIEIVSRCITSIASAIVIILDS
eukprot:CAMPEP_0172515730 /NCGR_PEP_ID=MMETSP1066-20121228/270152_1 /TAXON_ID=671091 /ORGANISM="Coscinodiscus wailesii, Strain CCMP2513" /LENGTH=785 /DNA_ID=CAMNT_0013296881 /DNA_START=1 /DNA_END=2359 /DNA_ORIENTATION=+